MKKPINITESDLKRIVKESVEKILTEAAPVDENALIDKIGMEVEPLYKKLAGLKFVYESYAGNQGFLGSVVKDLVDATNRLEHLIYIVNH